MAPKCPDGQGDDSKHTTPPSLVQGAELSKLSAREMQVLAWTAKGKIAAQVGELLFLTERTVNFHVARAIIKLKASNKTEAVAIAVRAGWI